MGLDVEGIAAFYKHLTTHIVPGPNNISYFVPLFLLPIALCISPDAISHTQLCIIFLPPIYASLLRSWQLMHGVDVISLNIAIWSFVLLVCYDPRTKFELIHLCDDRGNDEDGVDTRNNKQDGWHAQTQKRSINPPTSQHDRTQTDLSQLHHEARDPHVTYHQERYPARLAPRIAWVLSLLPSLRLTHWRINLLSHDSLQPPQAAPRLAFLRTALTAIVFGYCLLDLTSVYISTDAYFRDSSISVNDPLPFSPSPTPVLTLFLQFIPPRLVRTSIIAAQIYALIPLMFFLPTLPAIALNSLHILPSEWSPHTWPPFFGKFSSVFNNGLRGLWGSWWHQMNRYPTSTPGRWLADRLGLPEQTAMRYAFLVVSAFGLGGLIHTGLIPAEPLRTTMKSNDMRLYVAGFFWMQIPGILIETAIARLIEKKVKSVVDWKVSKAFVLTWVVLWMSMTLPLLTPPFRELGYWQVWPVPVSLIRGVIQGTWWMWW